MEHTHTKRIVNKRAETARKIVMELMTEAAYKKWVTIEQTFFIDEKNMKDIQKQRFNVGPIATYNSADDGLTPLICRGQSADPNTQCHTQYQLPSPNTLKHYRLLLSSLSEWNLHKHINTTAHSHNHLPLGLVPQCETHRLCHDIE